MQNDNDYDNVDRIVRQRYDQEIDFRNMNVRQIRGVMNYHNIPYRDDNGNILPQYRTKE